MHRHHSLCVRVQIESSACFVSADDESAQTGDVAMETDCMDEGCGLTRSEPMGERREPLGSVNWKPEADDKENNNGTSAEEPLAVKYDTNTHTPKYLKHNDTDVGLFWLYVSLSLTHSTPSLYSDWLSPFKSSA